MKRDAAGVPLAIALNSIATYPPSRRQIESILFVGFSDEKSVSRSVPRRRRQPRRVVGSYARSVRQ